MSSKIQVRLHKFVFFLFALFHCAAISAQEAPELSIEERLARADSLYEQRQYTESLTHYQEIFSEHQLTSPAILMKMAFIQESRGEYSEALYYLNEYYQLTADERAVRKIQQLSEEYGLQGYEYTDYDLFYRYFREYRRWITYGLAAVTMLVLIYTALVARQQPGKPYGWGVACLVLIGFLFVMTNYSLKAEQAIIMDDYTYIMTAPSPGADVKDISKKGHRVTVNGQEDVWTKIEWNGEPAFVRQTNLRTIRP